MSVRAERARVLPAVKEKARDASKTKLVARGPAEDPVAGLMNDPTLRRGDIVVLPGGAKVFKGGANAPPPSATLKTLAVPSWLLRGPAASSRRRQYSRLPASRLKQGSACRAKTVVWTNRLRLPGLCRANWDANSQSHTKLQPPPLVPSPVRPCVEATVQRYHYDSHDQLRRHRND